MLTAVAHQVFQLNVDYALDMWARLRKRVWGAIKIIIGHYAEILITQGRKTKIGHIAFPQVQIFITNVTTNAWNY